MHLHPVCRGYKRLHSQVPMKPSNANCAVVRISEGKASRFTVNLVICWRLQSDDTRRAMRSSSSDTATVTPQFKLTQRIQHCYINICMYE